MKAITRLSAKRDESVRVAWLPYEPYGLKPATRGIATECLEMVVASLTVNSAQPSVKVSNAIAKARARLPRCVIRGAIRGRPQDLKKVLFVVTLLQATRFTSPCKPPARPS